MFELRQIPVVWSDRLDAVHVERWAALRRDRDHAGRYNLVHDREQKRLRAELERMKEPKHAGAGIVSNWKDVSGTGAGDHTPVC